MPEHQQTQQSTESKTTFQKQATPRIQAPSSHPMAIIQRARINPKSLTHADVMQLQSTIGNRAVVRLLTEIGAIPSKAKQAPPVQRQELVQRQEIPEEEEPLQGKFENKPEIACPSCFAAPIVQRQEIPEEEEPLQGKTIGTIQRQEIPEEEEPLQTKRENNTGMPDNLKAGVENLSGIDMSDVRVHYNSSKPAEVGALAYTQGANIHVAPGQERHLPHEAWHVAQQKQGRVRATMQIKGVGINDDAGLEEEADGMGRRTAQLDALAYVQGKDIHVGQGQESNLAHEAWNVVQQQTMTQSIAQRKVMKGEKKDEDALWEDVLQEIAERIDPEEHKDLVNEIQEDFEEEIFELERVSIEKFLSRYSLDEVTGDAESDTDDDYDPATEAADPLDPDEILSQDVRKHLGFTSSAKDNMKLDTPKDPKTKMYICHICRHVIKKGESVDMDHQPPWKERLSAYITSEKLTEDDMDELTGPRMKQLYNLRGSVFAHSSCNRGHAGEANYKKRWGTAEAWYKAGGGPPFL